MNESVIRLALEEAIAKRQAEIADLEAEIKRMDREADEIIRRMFESADSNSSTNPNEEGR